MNRETIIALIALPIIFFSNLALGVFLEFSYRFVFFDTAHHFLGGFFVALFMFGYLYEIAISRNVRTIKKWLVILGATLFVGVMWEFAEWISTTYNGILTIGDLNDTLLDLASDLVGGITLLLLHPVRNRNSQDI